MMSEINIVSCGQFIGFLSIATYFMSFDLNEREFNLLVFPMSILFILISSLYSPFGGLLLIGYLAFSDSFITKDFEKSKMLDERGAGCLGLMGIGLSLASIIVVSLI